MKLLKQLGDLLTRRDQSEAHEADVPCSKCDATGWVACRCGGDICVCENHGEKRCPNGCAEE